MHRGTTIEIMARDESYGDQLTLYAAANLYNIDIQIVSSLGAGGQHVFSPSASYSNSTATVYLGHFAVKSRRTLRELRASCG